MGELTDEINWIAVIAGTVLASLLGWLWFSPKLFGQKWAAGVGIDLDASSEMPGGALAVQILGNFLLAWTIGVTAVADALLTAILMILTLVVLMSAGGMFAKKSGQAIGIEVGFVIAMAAIMIVCQGMVPESFTNT